MTGNNPKITVLFVETGNHGGGSFESLYQNVAHMDRNRFNPIVLYFNRTHQLPKMQKLGVDVYLVKDLLYNNYMPEILKRCMVGFGWFLGKIFPRSMILYELIIHFWSNYNIKKIIRNRNVNVIQLNNNVVRNFFCIVALSNVSVPIISYLRSFIIKGINPYMADFSNKTVTRYVAYSEGVKDFWANVGVDPENTEIVHNGIEIEEVKAIDVWKRIGIPSKRGPLIGCVGAVKVNRTYDFMIRAMARILQEEPEAHLVIVGTWMDRGLAKKLLELIDRLNIAHAVTLHGHDSMAKHMIAGLDVLAIPYRIEPYGRVLLEAWMAKTPVIATHVGKIDRIISHEKDGLLVEHGDESEMCLAVMKICKNKTFRESMIQQGRWKVESKFSIQACTKELEALFERVVLERKHRATEWGKG